MAFGQLSESRADRNIGGDAARHHQSGRLDIGKIAPEERGSVATGVAQGLVEVQFGLPPVIEP